MACCSVWKEREKHAELTLLYFVTKIIIILRFSVVKKRNHPTKIPKHVWGGRGQIYHGSK